ncbi:PhzF family phenazine biosynthesis protein [Alicyclobacillus macrosporangiidus]|uniref:Phenazine biosynthesis protein PhzF family n=1 Tax=Alicyclobacillus macrosporangiidus TaxID=392015 RepID=A0A1I7GYH4_9BACL|nr:PhzF family phenazine biosynthesis protein [Alicyclobacillus macrosporangiidus]SFU53514.1 phenazine biosynthesis protein PhzF family [Alicyclobacillus macrosporangiidus]
MPELSVFHVDAFTDRPFGGNPAGVVPDARGLADAQMQAIARELNLSETAFLVPGEGEADFSIRYFTPAAEVAFCGHATLGAAWLLATEYGWAERAGQVVFRTPAGIVPVRWEKGADGRVKAAFMEQVRPKVRPTQTDVRAMARLLGLRDEDMDPRYPLRLAYTGNWDLLVPVRTRAAVDRARPDFPALAEANRREGVISTHLFTFDADDPAGHPADKPAWDLYTRDFSPAVGVAEDPVTGSASGALGGYLVLEGVLDPARPHELVMAQGDAVGRPGRVIVRIQPGTDGPRVEVGGGAVVTVAGRLRLPD